MSTVNASFSRDNNRIPITNLGIVTPPLIITYSALTTGAVGVTTLFTTTGIVGVRLFAVAGAIDLTGSGTIEVGIAGNTAALIAQTAATAIDAGEIWYGTNPPTVGVLPGIFILNGTNIIQTIATDTVTAGSLTYYALWNPISANGNLV